MFSSIPRFSLHLIAAQRIHRLGRQADVSHHRNLRFGKTRNQLQSSLSAFHLYCFRPGFFYETHGVAMRLCRIRVIAAERHVGDDQRAPRTPPHRARVMQHVFEGHRKRAFVTQHYHTEGIANEYHIHPGFIEQSGGRIVVGRQGGDFF